MGAISIHEITRDYLEAATKCHLDCFEDDKSLASLIGKDFIKNTYSFFVQDEKSFGYIAYQNDKPVGIIFCRLDYYVNDLNKYKPRILSFIKSVLINPLLLFKVPILKKIINLQRIDNSKNNLDIPSHIENKVSTIASLGVLNIIDSSIIASKLLEKAEQSILDNNKLIVRAGISRSNIKPLFFFKKRGYSIDSVISSGDQVFMYKKL